MRFLALTLEITVLPPSGVLSSTLRLMLYTVLSLFSLRYWAIFPACGLGNLGAEKGVKAHGSTIQGLIVVAKLFAVKGPKGTYSKRCTSRADQSFINTYPKIYSSASEIFIGCPKVLDLHRKQANSSSMSSERQGENVGDDGCVGSRSICPWGRVMGVPDTMTEEARPW